MAWPCHGCAVRNSSFCGSLIDRPSTQPAPGQNSVTQVFASADKHEIIQPGGAGYLSGPFVLCKGWAYRFYRFPDGRRQILSVLIPGDLFSAFALLDSRTDFSVQAVTDIEVCQFGRDDVKRQLAAEPHVCDAFGQLCAREIGEVLATSVDLKQGNPIKRVTGFIQRIIKRLAARGIAIGTSVYPFPLSVIDIADAIGLNPDDVNRSLQKLHENRVINISNDAITVLNSTTLENSR
jgi:CRP-like cAMP-binding protein